MADADFNVKAIISAQTSQFEKGIKNAQSSINTMSKSIEGVQKLLKTAFSVVGITASVGAIVNFGKSCVQSATQAQKAFNVLDNTIKATGADAWTSTKELDDLAKNLSNSTNYAVTEIEEMQSVLLGFRNITGDTFGEASEAIMDMATVMGMDLKSATQTVGKALDDPIKGLDSLRRQGFQFTDEQKAELTQLVKNGKQLEAQKIILNELANSYGGAAKAGQDSFAKQRHAIENFRDTLGGKLIPVMQVFAENSARTLNNLTNLISKMDFTPVVNVVTNLSKIFNSAFQNISNYLRNVKNEVTDFISRFNFKPIISILDTLAGVVITAFDKIKSRFNESSNMMNQFKEVLISFSNSETFQKIADVINTIIDAIVFLWDEIERVGGEIRNFVVGKVVEVWNKIKELFQNSQEALANSESDIKSWGDYFYSIFNNIFRIVQDLINTVSALLNGDWQVAWEYAKLAVLRVAESVATTLESIKNGFKDKMQEMLNIASLAVKFLPGGMGTALSAALKGLEGLTNTSSKMRSVIQEQVEETENKIQELTGHTADVAIKDLQGISSQFAGFTSSALGSIEDLTNGVATETEKQKNYFSGVASSAESSYEDFSEWDAKLLQQRLESLSEWSNEAHEVNLKLIEEERKKAEKADTTGKDAEKINKYYNKKIEQENERSEKAKRDMVKQTVLIAINQLKTIASNAVAVFKKVASTIKNAFSGIVNIFKKIFEFNPDEALDNLLKVEDAILTFFVETLPKLPGFFSSAIESIIKLIDTLMNVIDWSQISNILNSIVDVVIKNAPTIINNLLIIAENMIKTVLGALKNFVESGGWKMLLDLFLTIQKTIEQIVVDNIDDLVNTIIDMLPDLIETLKASIVSASRTLGKLAPKILPMIAELINAIVEVITSDEVIDSANEAVEGIVEGLVEAIIKLLPNAILKILNMAIKLANPQRVSKLAIAIVKGLAKAFAKIDWIQFVKECFMGLIDGFKELFGIHSPSTVFEGFGKNIMEGLLNGLKSLTSNIQNFFTNLFSKITDGIKSAFNGMKDWFTKFWDNIVSGASSAIEKAKKALEDTANKVGEAIKKGITGNNDDSASTAVRVATGVLTGGFSEIGRGLGWWANGTNNAPAGLSIVGEAGPELVKFRGGEQVLNNRNTNKALESMGKNTNNFNVTFNNLQDTTAFAMMQQLKAYNRQMAINGII